MRNILQFPTPVKLSSYAHQLGEIEGLVQALHYLPSQADRAQHVFHRQSLKSALYSARIEGNPLSMKRLEKMRANHFTNSHTHQVDGVMEALAYSRRITAPIKLATIKQLHRLVMGNEVGSGNLRSQSSAIYDGYGNIVYLTPEPNDVVLMLRIWLEQLNSSIHSDWSRKLELFSSAHYYFEKIHPFLDGNGRVGRVVLQYQLQHHPLLSSIILPIDQYFDQHRSEYYYFLEQNTRQLDGFFRFFLDGIIFGLKQFHQELARPQATDQSEQAKRQLLPRRQELLQTIADHPFISIDGLCRRFPDVSRRTLNYDLQALAKLELIEKMGVTRGVVYQVPNTRW